MKLTRHALKRNTRGSGVFTVSTNIQRVSAFTWRVRSRSDPRKTYLVYVQLTDTPFARCECKAFFFNGTCGHGDRVMELERQYAKANTNLYRQELERRAARGPANIKPY